MVMLHYSSSAVMLSGVRALLLLLKFNCLVVDVMQWHILWLCWLYWHLIGNMCACLSVWG